MNVCKCGFFEHHNDLCDVKILGYIFVPLLLIDNASECMSLCDLSVHKFKFFFTACLLYISAGIYQ